MSNIDKEWLKQKIADMEAARDEIPFGLDEDDSNTLAALRIALASLEAEPDYYVVVTSVGVWQSFCKTRAEAEFIVSKPFNPGYSIREIYSAPPEPANAEPVAWLWSHRKHPSEVSLVRPEDDDRAEGAHWSGWSCQALYAAPPAPVSVPDYPETLPCPVMLEPGLRFGKGVNTRTMLGALQRRAEYHAELESMTQEQRARHDAGMKEFAAMLQGADQATVKQPSSNSVLGWLRADYQDDNRGLRGNAPLFVLGKKDPSTVWGLDYIPLTSNSSVIPGCSCRNCRPVTMTDMRFVVCPECGNKRCPHANDHRNACTGSNEPGQEGSAYPAAPQQES
ncbi:hypothetical protein ACTLMW_002802 [Enterobacter roggenkampii]